MKEKIEQIRREISEGMRGVANRRQLFELKMQYLGKTGAISALSKGMRDIPPAERPAAGKLVGDVRSWAEEQFAAREEELKKEELAARYANERIDVTLPAHLAGGGSVHPVSLVKQELVDIFAGMGFDVFEGPEIEQDYYNFQALNIPADHPARDMQDTFFIGGEFLLRSQTSSGQIRVMENKKPPIKVLSPGRVYRSDSDAHVPSDGGPRRGQGDHAERPQGHAGRVCPPHVFLRDQDPPPSLLLSVHRTERRSRPFLP